VALRGELLDLLLYAAGICCCLVNCSLYILTVVLQAAAAAVMQAMAKHNGTVSLQEAPC
jgi:hypothetical protein